MITCCFLGHGKLYDHNMKSTIKVAITNIISLDNEIDFLFHDFGEFYFLCYDCVKKAKAKFKDKKITMTVVSQHPLEWDYWKVKFSGFSFDDFEKCICPVIEAETPYCKFNAHLFRWVIEHSTFVIKYVYFDLDFILKNDNHFTNNAKLLKIDLTKSTTQALIDEQRTKCSEIEQFIMKKRRQGFLYKQIASELNTNTSSVSSSQASAMITIRTEMTRVIKGGFK